MSKKINDGGPVYPHSWEETTPRGWNIRFDSRGISLRDYFAARAMGMGFDWCNLHETGGYAEAARVAYEMADAMLAVRQIPPFVPDLMDDDNVPE